MPQDPLNHRGLVDERDQPQAAATLVAAAPPAGAGNGPGTTSALYEACARWLDGVDAPALDGVTLDAVVPTLEALFDATASGEVLA